MAEAVFHSTQIGVETTFGTSVPATTVLPLDAGSGYAVLDRASEIPDEDVGRSIRNGLSARGSTGVRLVTGSMAAPACFQNLGHMLNMCLGVDVPSGAGPYAHTHTGIISSDTLKNYTLEINNDLQDFEIPSVTITRFTLGFDRLSAPGNAMWHWSADFQGVDLVKAAATNSLSAPALLETMEGHYTILSEGAIGTAFGSLSALTGSLERYELTIENPRPPRVTGSASTDVASGWGLGKRLVTVSQDLKFTSTTVTNFFDIYNVSGAVPTERRQRVLIDGSGNMSCSIDHRLQYKNVNIEESDGEIIVSVDAEAVYDATLATDLVIIDNNDTATLP